MLQPRQWARSVFGCIPLPSWCFVLCRYDDLIYWNTRTNIKKQKQNEFNAAIHSFSLCLECLRDNITMYALSALSATCRHSLTPDVFSTYTQLGLKYSLHYAEVQFNLGLCLIAAGRRDHGLNKLRLALIKSEKPEHAVISKVLNNGGIVCVSCFVV